MYYKILLLDGGGTQTLAMAESLFKKGHNVYIFVEHRFSYGYGTRYAIDKIIAPSIKNEEKYLIFLKNYIASNLIDILIPMSDPSAQFLSKNREILIKFCRFIIPDYDVFMNGYDKNRLMAICKEFNFPHPKTIDLTITNIYEIEDSIFPAILKPNITTGGRGMKVIQNKNELIEIFDNQTVKFGPCHLQQLISEGGNQYKVELILDEKQTLIGSSVIHKQRFYPIAGGSSCFNTTVNKDNLVDICFSVLRKINWIGFADFDLIEDPKDHITKIMEINPRIPACIKSAIKSGVDYASIIVDLSVGHRPQNYDYLPGKHLRHLGFDILWFLKCKDRLVFKPNWFGFFDKYHYFQDISLRDPMPFFFGTIGNIIKLFNSDFRKSKNSSVKVN